MTKHHYGRAVLLRRRLERFRLPGSVLAAESAEMPDHPDLDTHGEGVSDRNTLNFSYIP